MADEGLKSTIPGRVCDNEVGGVYGVVDGIDGDTSRENYFCFGDRNIEVGCSLYFDDKLEIFEFVIDRCFTRIIGISI